MIFPAKSMKTIKIKENLGKSSKSKEFPKQIKLSERSSGWLESEVLAYLDECIKNR